MTATVYWACLDCPAHGKTTGTEYGADVKHAKVEQHATTTGTNESAVLRMAGGDE